jgi:lysophospholipid acyltransferase (LPLAT)-like uncharacterized protein
MPHYRALRIHALVSQHRDGRAIGEVIRRFGMAPIFGSSTRGSLGALRNTLAALKDGGLVGITPDGPQGPPHRAAAGVAQLAAMAGVPILPCAARTDWNIRLSTWDRMAIPLPFGRGVMVCGPVITVPKGGADQAVQMITDALNDVAMRADMLCPQSPH